METVTELLMKDYFGLVFARSDAVCDDIDVGINNDVDVDLMMIVVVV